MSSAQNINKNKNQIWTTNILVVLFFILFSFILILLFISVNFFYLASSSETQSTSKLYFADPHTSIPIAHICTISLALPLSVAAHYQYCYCFFFIFLSLCFVWFIYLICFHFYSATHLLMKFCIYLVSQFFGYVHRTATAYGDQHKSIRWYFGEMRTENRIPYSS